MSSLAFNQFSLALENCANKKTIYDLLSEPQVLSLPDVELTPKKYSLKVPEKSINYNDFEPSDEDL